MVDKVKNWAKKISKKNKGIAAEELGSTKNISNNSPAQSAIITNSVGRKFFLLFLISFLFFLAKLISF
jgi:hypothetical protein